MKKGKPFFYRIDLIDLMDFATEPAGLSMTLLEFAKELKKGISDHAPIQKIIEEANNYIEKKKNAGRSGGKARVSNAQALLEQNQASVKPEAVTETVTETTKEKVKRFVPPSLQEVETYITENNYPVDPMKWFNHYSSNGWKVGKNKMVNWHSAIATWLPEKPKHIELVRRKLELAI